MSYFLLDCNHKFQEFMGDHRGKLSRTLQQLIDSAKLLQQILPPTMKIKLHPSIVTLMEIATELVSNFSWDPSSSAVTATSANSIDSASSSSSIDALETWLRPLWLQTQKEDFDENFGNKLVRQANVVLCTVNSSARACVRSVCVFCIKEVTHD